MYSAYSVEKIEKLRFIWSVLYCFSDALLFLFVSSLALFVAKKNKSQWNWTLIHCEQPDKKQFHPHVRFIYRYLWQFEIFTFSPAHTLTPTKLSSILAFCPHHSSTVSLSKVILYVANMSFTLCWSFVHDYFFLGRSVILLLFDKKNIAFGTAHREFHISLITYYVYIFVRCLCLWNIIFLQLFQQYVCAFVYLFVCSFLFVRL